MNSNVQIGEVDVVHSYCRIFMIPSMFMCVFAYVISCVDSKHADEWLCV